MIEKKASVQWAGAGKTGQGKISTETGALSGYPYGFGSRVAAQRAGFGAERLPVWLWQP
eukprot:gene4157-5201_t